MTLPPPRLARIVLVRSGGRLMGVLPATPIATPWWQDIEPVGEAVRRRFGVEVTVLRLLTIDEPGDSGIVVTYLAETTSGAPVEPWVGTLDEHPLRLPYARPGGPEADLAWASGVLSGHGLIQTGAAVQVRTWNLSSLWRIPVEGQTLWLKVVPPFFAHEGDVLEALAGDPVPILLGHQGCRMLMAEIPGVDLYDADPALLPRMVDLLVGLQRKWASRTDKLIDLGLPDWRGGRLATIIRAVFARNAAELAPEDRTILEGFVAALPGRLAEIADCGLPDTLVHADFHPGNLRGGAEALTLLDWGDCGVGHPLLDQSAMLERTPADAVEPLRRHWHEAWRAASPGSDPERASRLVAPVAAARRAAVYQAFLDQIEPSEHPYHRSDPLAWLRRTATLLRLEGRDSAT